MTKRRTADRALQSAAARAELPGIEQHPSPSVNVVPVRDGQVLLTRREDFDVWCLPGGHVDFGEALRAAAARELQEETGFDVGEAGVGALVGEYHLRGAWHPLATAVFLVDLAGCAQHEQTTPYEVTELRWFAFDDLPTDFMWWQEVQLHDALAGRRDMVRSDAFASPFTDVGRVAVYAARDASGLARREFFELAYPNQLVGSAR